MSDPLILSQGEPQGSIFGPSLFSLYRNDVAKAIWASLIHLYADDTIIYSSDPSLHSASFLSPTQAQSRSLSKTFSTRSSLNA